MYLEDISRLVSLLILHSLQQIFYYALTLNSSLYDCRKKKRNVKLTTKHKGMYWFCEVTYSKMQKIYMPIVRIRGNSYFQFAPPSFLNFVNWDILPLGMFFFFDWNISPV